MEEQNPSKDCAHGRGVPRAMGFSAAPSEKPLPLCLFSGFFPHKLKSWPSDSEAANMAAGALAAPLRNFACLTLIGLGCRCADIPLHPPQGSGKKQTAH